MVRMVVVGNVNSGNDDVLAAARDGMRFRHPHLLERPVIRRAHARGQPGFAQ